MVKDHASPWSFLGFPFADISLDPFRRNSEIAIQASTRENQVLTVSRLSLEIVFPSTQWTSFRVLYLYRHESSRLLPTEGILRDPEDIISVKASTQEKLPEVGGRPSRGIRHWALAASSHAARDPLYSNFILRSFQGPHCAHRPRKSHSFPDDNLIWNPLQDHIA